MFAKLYDKAMLWARHKNAPRYLAGLSFAESSFFPIPPDVMLAPMSLAQPQRAFHYATTTTVASVIGGLFGYLIGYFFFEAIEPSLRDSHYWEGFQQVQQWFTEWGFWAILLAGFTPIPYKLFTIAAGVIGMTVAPFILASLVGRGARFYLVATLMAWGGERMERLLRRYVDRIGWLLILAVILGYFAING